MSVPDPPPDAPAPVHVEGCDCGTVHPEWHQNGCSIWLLPYAEAQAAVGAAMDRQQP